MLKCDLHVHIDENADSEVLKKMLTMAENEKVKGLGILSYNSLNIYAPNGIFNQVINEGISKYYTGKIISAVEMVTQIDKIPSSINFDYYGYRADICLYDFEYEKLQKYFETDLLKEYWIEDFNTFKKLSHNIGVEIPDISNFVNDYHPLSFVEQIQVKYPDIIKQFSDILNIQILVPSDLTRNHITNPKGKLFFEQKLFPKLSTILKIAKDVNCKVAIAHPAYMSNQFNTTDYIKSLVEFSRSDESFKQIEYVCGDYMLNSKEDREEIKNIANELNLKLICGSDMRLLPKMYYKGKLSPNDKIEYQPKIGYAIAKDLEKIDNGDLLMEKSVLDTFKNLI